MGADTHIIIPEDSSQPAGIATSRRKWINRLEALETQGLAEEVESSVDGAREWEMNQDEVIIMLPFRKPREMTNKQKEAARKRLAKVRERVAAQREAEAEDEEDDEPEDEPEVEEEETIDVEDEAGEDEEEDVVAVKKSRKRRKGKKGKK
jgi:hypothetical protein